MTTKLVLACALATTGCAGLGQNYGDYDWRPGEGYVGRTIKGPPDIIENTVKQYDATGALVLEQTTREIKSTHVLTSEQVMRILGGL